MRLPKQRVRQRKEILKDKIRFAKRSFFSKLVPLSLVTIFFISILIINLSVRSFLFKSEHFRVSRVDVLVLSADKEEIPKELEEIKAWGIYENNIFKINLKELKFKIASFYPELKDINIVRVLPNQLKISAKQRRKIAQIDSGRYFPIDMEGVILPEITNLPDKGLPIISGFKPQALNRFGARLDEKRIQKALELIQEIEENRNISNYQLKKIDISDSRNLSFFLGSGLEVKIGESNFKERLRSLQTILAELGPNFKEIKYIDLRFEDPIVSSK